MNDPAKPKPGEMVVLTAAPAELLNGLPQEDQHAIVAIVGTPVLLLGYDEIGRAELQFDDPLDTRTGRQHIRHTIWVSPTVITRFQR